MTGFDMTDEDVRSLLAPVLAALVADDDVTGDSLAVMFGNVVAELCSDRAAAEAENKRVRDLAAAVVALQPADPDTGDRAVSLLALMEALDGES